MNEIAPCKGCLERHTACHGSCDKYKQWRDRYHAQQKHFETNRNRWSGPWTSGAERRYRRDRKFGAIGHKQGGIQ